MFDQRQWPSVTEHGEQTCTNDQLLADLLWSFELLTANFASYLFSQTIRRIFRCCQKWILLLSSHDSRISIMCTKFLFMITNKGIFFKKTRSTQRAQTSAERQHNRIVAVLPGSESWSGFRNGIPDPDGDPDRHQNLITWSLGHPCPIPLQEISSKSVHNFFSYPTDRQTNRPKWKHNLLRRR